jgi:hypothetical protein
MEYMHIYPLKSPSVLNHYFDLTLPGCPLAAGTGIIRLPEDFEKSIIESK